MINKLKRDSFSVMLCCISQCARHVQFGLLAQVH